MTTEERELVRPLEYVNKEDLVRPIEYVDKKKSFEEKEYLILLQYYKSPVDDEDYDERSYEFVEGRTSARELIISLVEYIDVYESKVLTEGVPLENAVSVYEFIDHIQAIYNDGFDINEYVIGDYEEDSSDDDNEGGVMTLEERFNTNEEIQINVPYNEDTI